MQRIKAFLLLDGAMLSAMGIFLLYKLNQKSYSHFKDDLWAERKTAEKLGKLPEFEDKVDNKILLEHRPDPAEKEESTASGSQAFRTPNFRGGPHDVLGIPANADTSLVNRAFKHWIMRYHPDRVTHLGTGYVEQARRRSEQLNTARQALLAKLKK
ncbi:MAG: J domain-containing protein [Bdellovibrionota bacterium]